ncbi:autotransporter-associated N-terminal domain-containing protein [Fusobacterium animalis]|uniref:autotransporter-associated N-terminal domain-containing protein n=1 Tax=Fusobacterium animalis TaxID=76859 RepID=UPI0035698675
MGNNLCKVEKDLRSIAKRYKSVKYSLGLAILFLMLGVSAFSEEVNTEQMKAVPTREEIVSSKENLKNSVGGLQTKINDARSENEKALKGLRLELIQLMEQGNQVVKSPWSSWQFGMNYFYDRWGSEYKGRGDKSQKYLFNGIYTRGNWKVRNAMDVAENQRVGGRPLTPGNDSLNSWKNANNSSNGGVKIDRDNSISSSTNGNRSWGLVDLENLREPTNEVEILARISPKEVTKQAISLNITEPTVQTLEAPDVNPQVNEPLPAPVIELPEVETVNISPLTINAPSAPTAPNAPSINIGIIAPEAPSAPTAPSAPEVPTITVSPSAPGSVTAPTINISVTAPTITALNITPPSAVTPPNVVSPNIKPVDFAIDPAGDSVHYKRTAWSNIPTTVNVTALTNRDYITLNSVNGIVQSPANQIINVTANNNRALVVDEALNGGNVTYKGSINLQKSQNVGIDLQGTHQGGKSAPAILTVNNAGTITGVAKDGATINKEQIAFGFNNADASRNTTMSHMINSGEISLNAPSSAGIQLKPEDPHYWQPQYWSAAPLQIDKKTPNKTMGRVLMKAENTGNLNLNGTGSFGIVTVFNKGVPKNLFIPSFQSSHEDLRSERLYDGQRVLPGGEIGRSALADEKYRSGIYNTGNINISGDNSIAVGLLQEIQEVKLGGNINIGTKAVTQETGISNLANTASKTYNVNKVEEAVGVFAGVPTMPVRPGEKDTLIVDNTLGNVANSLVGTETVELIKTNNSTGITLGEHATESIGALVGDTEVDLNNGKLNGVVTSGRKLKRSGDITAKSGYTINVGGNKNYGFVVSNSGHSSKFSSSTVDDLLYSVDKNNHGRGINEGEINVTGTSSIGFALIKGGHSSNSGKITVGNKAEDSIGFYGKEDNFANSGTIQVTSSKDKNKAIVLDGTNTTNKINFTNTGNVYVNTADNSNTNLIGTGNIGVYAQGNYKFDHNSGTVKAGTNAIAFYVKDTTGQVNIKAPIVLSNSGTGANAGTTIGIYSDGNAQVQFGQNSKLTIGEGAVGLYSANPANFNNTFKIETGKVLNVELGKNSTFGLLNGNKSTTASPLLSKYLNNGTTDKINITSFGEGASIFYATLKANAILDTDYTVTNGSADSTSVLVANDGANVEIASGKTLTTNTNVGLIATGGARVSGTAPVAENKGNLISTRANKGIGIYVTYGTGKNSGTITMNNKNAVGMLATIGSTLTNSKKIELNGVSSAGIYGENSDMTNLGANSEIVVNKEASAGMYSKLTSASSVAKNSKNEGKIKINADGAGKSVAMYSKVESGTEKLNTENTGIIEVAQKASAGIYADNISSQANTQSEVTNTGLVKMTAEASVGIIGKKSKVTNNSTGTKGIEILGTGSAGILAGNNSEVINSGRIEGKTGTNLVGISVDSSSTVANSGTITMGTASNTGISTKGGDVTNSGTITLSGATSTGISSENANVTNSVTTGKIEVKNGNSMGIYVKLAGNVNKTVSNAGKISLETPTGLSPVPQKSAAIYSLLDSGSGTLTTNNTGTVDVEQTGSAGIYAKNSTGTRANSVVTNSGIINVAKETSAGILGEKSEITNSGTGSNGIELTAKKTAGVIGNNDSKVTNSGRIETKTATPGSASEGLVGISLNASTGNNDASGTITLGTAYSTGMYGVAKSILTNDGTINGNKQNAVGIATKASTATNTGTITLSAIDSTGMFGLTVGSDKSTLTNKGTINGNGVGAVGIAADNSTAENSSGATINLISNKSTGIFGKAKSILTNAGTIELKTASPTSISEGLVGIALNDSTGTNTSSGQIKLGTAYSTGMFGENNSTLTNEGSIIGDKASAVGMAVKASTVTNKKTITLSAKNSTGIFGEDNSTLLNDTNGNITVKEESSVGIYSKGNNKIAENKGIILAEKKKSAGMLGSEGNLENSNSITTQDKESVGMYVENSSATNKKTITANGKKSAGVYVKLDKAAGGTIAGTNKGTNATITMTNEGSAAMLGEVKSSVTNNSATLTLTNQNSIAVNTKETVGMIITNDTTGIPNSNVKALNTGTIDLNSGATNKDNIGILANKRATGINEKNINVNSKSSVGMLAKEGSNIENNTTSGTINLKAESGIGMLADGKDASGNISTAVNNARIVATSIGKRSLGMLAQNNGKVGNNKNIDILAENGVGIFVSETGVGENTSTGTISLENKEAVGIFAKNNGTNDTAKNSGTINLGKTDGSTSHESLIGMFAQAESGKTASVKNTKDININTKKSVGMYAKNDASNITDVDLENTGDININSQESAGIYAPKSNISKVGTITLKDSTVSNGSSAVYVSNGGKVVDTASAKINLGTVNQNRVAYYVNGKDSALAGANIGKITGYGVGVYLQGASGDKATLDSNTSKLDYTAQGTGNGIIGLLLKGETDIQSYIKGIKVGNTVPRSNPSDKDKYAIGIYADAQGTAGTPYNITTPITAGKNGVGIFADKDSNINYTGNMEIGDGTTAGTGIFITKKNGTTRGKVTLGSNTIKLKGTKGVVAIASEGTEFNGGTATIELEGKDVQGVGVYGKKGSDVDVSHWNFNNHGNSAEEVRSEEGKVHINGNKNLKPRMVLTHVINGETSIVTGKTVTSINDGSITAKENIGLMAEGIKNHGMTIWQEGNFEAVNHGTIDFSAAEKSTAMFINSARGKNDGTIKVGKNSIGIYGFYNKDTRKYEGAPASPDPNKLEIETTSNSKISLGDASTGMYLINAEKIENKGGQITSESGATKNVGIYAVNGQDSINANNKNLTMTTAANIALGNGSVGLYSKGQSYTVRNSVTNTGNITVGDKMSGSPSVAMYAENTNLTTDSKITVGKDGIAFYGKNSDITAKGSANFSNKGVLAYLENSKFISHLGNLGATQNTMLYLKNSIAQLDGAGTKVDMDVADGYTGAYIEGNSTLTGVKTIKLGQDSTGLFLKDANFVSNAESITGTKDKARGILATNSNLTNNSKIFLSGAESIGIYSNANNTKSVVNNGELTIAGKKTLGVFLKGSQSLENKASINIADSANSLEPTIGIYTAEGSSNIKHTSGTIDVGQKSIGIYSTTNSNVEMNGGKIHVKDQGVGIYKQNGKATIKGELDIDTHIATAKDSEPTGVYAVNGTEINDQASKISIGAKSYGFILNNTDVNKTNIYNNTNTGTVTMGNDSVFLYSNGKAIINNKRDISANNSNHLIAFYIKNGGDFTNNGTIDFSTGKGNIGIYAPGGKATNKGRILVGATDDIDPMTGKVYTDVSKIVYGIGMAADNSGHIVNEGEIRIYNNKSIGMYGKGVGTTVENKGTISLDGSRATATNKIQSMTGVYVDDGATFKNYGTITTTDSYAGRDGKVNENVTGLAGVAVMNGSTLENHGKIYIDADNSYGVIIRGKRDTKGNVERYAVIKNYGEIKVRGKGTWGISWKDVSQADIDELQKQINSKISSDPERQALREAEGTDKNYQGVTITVKDGKPTFLRNGVPISDSEVEQIGKLIGKESNLGMSDIGFYVDTLGRTKPIDIDGANPPINSQLIIGTEYSEKTNKKQWFVKGDVIKPFLDQIQGRNFKLTSIAGSLTWIATPVLDNYGQITGVAMAKLPYTSFVKKTDNAWNFTDGLEQRYDMNALDSVEKRIFNKLNGIGKNEEALLTQAYDEMMGHQYANVQQRVQATGNILDKEFNHLRDSWSNSSKDSNKIKTFGMKGEYKTDTAGVIDYKYNAYGVAYVHENEDIKLGRGTGWYTGIVHNTFKFKDIGNSKEEQLQAKVGLFKSVPFDDNNSLNWTISGDMFVGYNKVHRKFLVVDEIFNAKSKYYTYGIGIKNEIGKEFRLSEGFSIRPYGALKVEYGRVSKIKEKSGEVRLEVKHNDYLSIKPEVGTELAYRHYFGIKTLRTSLEVAYENELGRVANGKNKAKVAYTNADWFNIRGEKEDRRGNVKFDLNVGLDNQRLGVTGNVGYDTKGHNVRGGVGLRVIF